MWVKQNQGSAWWGASSFKKKEGGGRGAVERKERGHTGGSEAEFETPELPSARSLQGGKSLSLVLLWPFIGGKRGRGDEENTNEYTLTFARKIMREHKQKTRFFIGVLQ